MNSEVVSENVGEFVAVAVLVGDENVERWVVVVASCTVAETTPPCSTRRSLHLRNCSSKIVCPTNTRANYERESGTRRQI